MGRRGRLEDKLGGWITAQVSALIPESLGAVGRGTRSGRRGEGEGLMSPGGRSRTWMGWCWTHWLSSGR